MSPWESHSVENESQQSFEMMKNISRKNDEISLKHIFRQRTAR